MKTLIFYFIFLFTFDVFSKSNDSPNLDFKKKENESWDIWILNLKKDLKKENYKESTLNLLDKIKFNPKVIEYDRKQPEFKLTFNEYLKRNINKSKKKEINFKYQENKELLFKIRDRFEIDPRVLVSLWAIETSFGKYLGKLDILRSLVSLAYDGRRKKFFLKELRLALKILDDGHLNKSQFKGSWAGAFGQTQFMPSTFHKYAIDFDKNKKINLFEKADALASGANYLKNAGWSNDILWGEKVDIVVNEKFRRLSKKKQFRKIKFWENNGISLKNNYNNSNKLRLIIPDSEENQFFLVTKNFDVILDWNRSNYFALTVFLLSNEIKN